MQPLPQPPVVYVKDAPTKVIRKKYPLKRNAELLFPGGIPPYHRRQFIITNNAGANVLHLRVRTAANVAAASEPKEDHIITVYPESTITLFTSADIWLRNPSDTIDFTADAVAPNVCEVFYV